MCRDPRIKPTTMKLISVWTIVLVSLFIVNTAGHRCSRELQKDCPRPSVCRTTTCPDGVTGGSDFRTHMIKLQNSHRRLAARNGSFPGDMTRLRWDPDLARAAQGWANELCHFDYFDRDTRECRRTEKYRSVGQILYLTWGPEFSNETAIARAAVDYWFEQSEHVPMSSMFPYKYMSSATGYTQMVWSRSYRVGCAYVRIPVERHGYKIWVVCNYALEGNLVGDGVNVFEPARRLGEACRAGSIRDRSGLCDVLDERIFQISSGIKDGKSYEVVEATTEPSPSDEDYYAPWVNHEEGFVEFPEYSL